MMVLKILTIGGSDTWGGGGIQTDLKTFENLQSFGLSVLTCIAVEKNEDFVIRSLPAYLIDEQLKTIESSFQLDGIKIGLLSNLETIELVQDFCKRNRGNFPIILDPVLAFKETEQHLQDEYIDKIKKLIPFADVVTPNLKEMKLLTNYSEIQTISDMEKTCQQLFAETGTPILLKGGTKIAKDSAIDYYMDGKVTQKFDGPISEKKTINGAGCCLSAAICSYLAQGFSMIESIKLSKRFVYEAIENGVSLGADGNVWHPNLERSSQ